MLDKTRGLRLLEQLGSFFNKVYPYKESLLAKFSGDEEIANQFRDTLNEVSSKLTYATCPLVKKERLRYFLLKERSTFLTTSANIVCGSPFSFYAAPIVGDASLLSYKVPSTIISIGKITDKPVNWGIELFPNQDYLVRDSRIVFKDTKFDLGAGFWGHDVSLEATYLQDSVGFLFFDQLSDWRIREMVILLLFMYRYGMRTRMLESFLSLYFHYPVALSEGEIVKEVLVGKVTTSINEYEYKGTSLVRKGDTLRRLQPIFDAVEIKDAAQSEFFIKNKDIVRHKLVSREAKWGECKWGQFRYGNTNYVEDLFFTELAKDIVYIATIKYANTYSLKYLTNLISAVPVWMKLNIILGSTLIEKYDGAEDSAEAHKGVYNLEGYKSFFDGNYGLPRWGGVVWGASTYGGPIQQNSVRLILQHHG